MRLEEVKKRVLALIEEINPESEYLTDDIDIQLKINYVIDGINQQLSRVKRIARIEKINATEGKTINLYEELEDFYKLMKIEDVDYDIFGSNVTFREDGEAKIYYFKYPKRINDKTNDKYTFEASNDVINVLVYGVAADLLKNDISAQYGAIYERLYKDALNMLEVEENEGVIRVNGGLNV